MSDNTPAASQPVTGYEDFSADAKLAQRLIDQQLAKHTRRMYRSNWNLFAHWCQQRALDPLLASPATLSLFLASQFKAGFHYNTLNQRLAAIKFVFQGLNQPSPTSDPVVRATLKGIRRDASMPAPR